MTDTIAVKLAKPIGRHYGKRLYKAGKIYHVDKAEGEYLLAYKDLDGINRFKRMIPKGEATTAPESEDGKPKKRRPGRPKTKKQSSKVDEVVDEKPVSGSIEEASKSDLVEQDVPEVQETETFDPSDDNQEYAHEV